MTTSFDCVVADRTFKCEFSGLETEIIVSPFLVVSDTPLTFNFRMHVGDRVCTIKEVVVGPAEFQNAKRENVQTSPCSSTYSQVVGSDCVVCVMEYVSGLTSILTLRARLTPYRHDLIRAYTLNRLRESAAAESVNFWKDEVRKAVECLQQARAGYKRAHMQTQVMVKQFVEI